MKSTDKKEKAKELSQENIYNENNGKAGKAGYISSINNLYSRFKTFSEMVNNIVTEISRLKDSGMPLQDMADCKAVKQECIRIYLYCSSCNIDDLTYDIMKIVTLSYNLNRDEEDVIRQIIFTNLQQIEESCCVIQDLGKYNYGHRVVE